MSFKRIIALIGAIIAVVEGLIMLGFGLLPALGSPMADALLGNPLIEAILDVTLLTVGSAPFVYLWIIRPVQAEHLREGVVKQALTEILQVAVQPIGLKEMLGRILGTLTELPWMDSEQEASLFITDDMGVSTMIAQRNVSPLRMATCGTVAKGNCRCGQAVDSGESSIGFCPDVPAEAEAAAADGGKRHVIPLRMAGESVGVLSICLHGKRTLSDTEQKFMDSVTQTLAEIIDKDRTQKRLAHGETLQAIMDHAPIGIFQTNTEGCPRFVNETLCRELGRSMDEVMSVKSRG